MKVVLFAIWVAINVSALGALVGWLSEGGGFFSFVNPIVIYDNVPVNWFGAICLSIVLNILFPVVALPYWIYKLFTVGRDMNN